MFSTPSQDMTAAWYAAAPPPPPPAPAKDRRASSVRGGYAPPATAIRSSSSSTSLSFDKRALGDDLPLDSYAPEPERPVSRNAMARQRERERQRARSNSNLGHEYAAAEHVGHEDPGSVQGQSLHSVRYRRESSPVVPAMYGHHPAYSQAGTSTPSPYTMTYSQSPAPIATPQQPWHSAHVSPVHGHPYDGQQQGYVNPAFGYTGPTHQLQHSSHGYASAPATPMTYQQQAPWQYSMTQTAEPQQIVYAAPTVQAPYGMPINHPVTSSPQWVSPTMQSPHIVDPAVHSADYQVAAVPFPTKPIPPTPVAQVYQGYAPTAYSTPPPTIHSSYRRALPSTSSRTSSQSSSVGTRASTASLGSMSGTVRRSLPQPPTPRTDSNAAVPALPNATASSITHATVRPSDVPASLGRHESVRMAAEEMMSRGPPRRRAGIPSSMMGGGGRTNAHANASRSDGSITDGGSVGVGRQHVQSTHAASRGRAESSGCLEKEMQALRIEREQELAQARQHAPMPAHTYDNVHKRASVPLPKPDVQPIRAASPRPIRAAPTPAPEVTIAAPINDIIPRRPLSRGPKDEQERRRSMDAAAAARSALGVARQMVHSPPPDQKPPVPNIAFDDEEPDARPAFGVPHINLPQQPEIHVTGDETITPSIQINVPTMVLPDGDDNVAERPLGTISISVSSSNVAQHSTSSNNAAPSCSHTTAAVAASLPPRSRYMAPEPASAPSVGSGAGCATCQKWISGKVVHAMGHTFHPDCFVCFHCSEHLEHVAFYEHEGRPYCHFDFHELFSKRCFHCRTPIVDQRYITINDPELIGQANDQGSATSSAAERCYHDTHFFCANCGDPFLDPKLAASAAGAEAADLLAHVVEDESDGSGNARVTYGGREFVVHKGYPYCEPCHVSLHKPRCKGCKRPIVDEEFLTALRAKWHVGCFCCQRCQRPIDSDNFFVRDNHAYDEECYKIKLRSEL